MRKLMLATAAATALAATPALARDGSGYIGVDGGLLFPKDLNSDITVLYPPSTVTGVPTGTVVYDDGADLNLKTGYDVDLIAGYDFGMFRLEGELGYKRSKISGIDSRSDLLDDLSAAADLDPPLIDDDIDLVGRHASVLSGMVNGLVDFGGDTGIGGFVGGGFGRASVKRLTDRDSAWAWQVIAGIRQPISDNIDVGLKYRYFRTGKLDFDGEFDFDTLEFPYESSGGHFSSHSLLLSLAYNFGTAAAPPPPPPPPPPPAPEPVAPATQTCPDGSVILATSACPLPPPPPPPPPVERGERGR